MRVINRDIYLKQIIAGRENGLIKIITGIRRGGKSFLLFRLYYKYLIESGVADDHIVRVAFDDWDFRHLTRPDAFMDYLKECIKDEERYYVLLDEVQLLDDFVPVLNGLLRKENLDIYVTGSNSRFLSSDIATEFRGRGDCIHVYPLSFAEYLSAVDEAVDKAWQEYYTYGGLPHITTLDSDRRKSEYLHNLYNTVYSVDVIERNRVKNVAELNELTEIIASSIGSPTNPRKLSNTFKSLKGKAITPYTINRYLQNLQDAFMVEKCIRFDIKGKKYINSLAKYYFTDIGIRNAILDFRQQEENHIMENIIYNELLIRGFNVDVGVVVYRTTDKDGKTIRKYFEVDFVANQGSQRYYIQSAFIMPTDAKERQESASLININDSFKKIIVVKENIKPKRNAQGILTIGLMDFLLNPHSLEY